MIKQIIIVRTDLNMRKGKLAAQVAHASMKVFLDRMKKTHDILKVNEVTREHKRYSYGVQTYHTTFTEEMEEWLTWEEGKPGFTKIVVGCNSEKELKDLAAAAEFANLPCAIILDNGMTEFKQECSYCKGEGLLHTAGVLLYGECPECKGTGKVPLPTYTCLAIGPAESGIIDNITGYLKLL